MVATDLHPASLAVLSPTAVAVPVADLAVLPLEALEAPEVAGLLCLIKMPEMAQMN